MRRSMESEELLGMVGGLAAWSQLLEARVRRAILEQILAEAGEVVGAKDMVLCRGPVPPEISVRTCQATVPGPVGAMTSALWSSPNLEFSCESLNADSHTRAGAGA